MGMCPSPPLIAAFHVLHRLKVPRHSPFALSSLTIKLVHKQIFLYVVFDLRLGDNRPRSAQIKPANK